MSEPRGKAGQVLNIAAGIALIVVVCITAITTLGTNSNNTFSYVGNKIKVTPH